MTGAVKCTVMYAFFRLVIFIILLADVSILPTGYFELNLFAYCFDMAVASVLLATSTDLGWNDDLGCLAVCSLCECFEALECDNLI